MAKVIIGVNAGVFLLWRLPGLQQSLRNSSSLSRLPGMGRFLRWDAENFMYHHFSISTLGHVRQAPHTLVTSFFSHSSPFHLAFNMFALSSLSPALVSLLGAGHFLAFYMTAGVVANLGAVAHGLVRSLVHVWRGVRRHGHHSEATLARKMQAEMQSLPLLFGLGASGAVFALFAANARLFPDQEWMLIFLPGIPIRSETMLTGLVCFDTLGLVVTALGTSTGLGHAAHLTGVMCGLLYMQYLQISNTRVKRIMQQNQRNREAQAQN